MTLDYYYYYHVSSSALILSMEVEVGDPVPGSHGQEPNEHGENSDLLKTREYNRKFVTQGLNPDGLYFDILAKYCGSEECGEEVGEQVFERFQKIKELGEYQTSDLRRAWSFIADWWNSRTLQVVASFVDPELSTFINENSGKDSEKIYRELIDGGSSEKLYAIMDSLLTAYRLLKRIIEQNPQSHNDLNYFDDGELVKCLVADGASSDNDLNLPERVAGTEDMVHEAFGVMGKYLPDFWRETKRMDVGGAYGFDFHQVVALQNGELSITVYYVRQYSGAITARAEYLENGVATESVSLRGGSHSDKDLKYAEFSKRLNEEFVPFLEKYLNTAD